MRLAGAAAAYWNGVVSGVELYSTCDVVVHSKAQTDTMTICIMDDNQRRSMSIGFACEL